MKTFFLLLLACGSALADDGALLRCRAMPDPANRLACYDAIMPAAGATRSAAAPVEALDPAAAKQALEQSFGMEYKQKAALDSIESFIPGLVDGWVPKQKFKLANGQVWMVVDDSDGTMYRTNPKIVVTRGALGALYMEIEGAPKSPKVRRLQ